MNRLRRLLCRLFGHAPDRGVYATGARYSPCRRCGVRVDYHDWRQSRGGRCR